jgi:hypothetical protein
MTRRSRQPAPRDQEVSRKPMPETGLASARVSHIEVIVRQRIAAGYRGASAGVPADLLRAYEALIAEVVRFDGTGRASPQQRCR